jgi:hypothetical protein
LAYAIRQRLANMEAVQANVALQTATVARFEAPSRNSCPRSICGNYAITF